MIAYLGRRLSIGRDVGAWRNDTLADLDICDGCTGGCVGGWLCVVQNLRKAAWQIFLQFKVQVLHAS